jgi:hypothetical protein
MMLAIDYIKTAQAQERQVLSELHRLRDASEYARDAGVDIKNLQTEIAVMQERLRLVEPGNPHVYGAHSSHLSQLQAQAQANGQPHQYTLPSMNSAPPPPQPYNGSGTTSQGMQGVEYGNASRHH